MVSPCRAARLSASCPSSRRSVKGIPMISLGPRTSPLRPHSSPPSSLLFWTTVPLLFLVIASTMITVAPVSAFCPTTVQQARAPASSSPEHGRPFLDQRLDQGRIREGRGGVPEEGEYGRSRIRTFCSTSIELRRKDRESRASKSKKNRRTVGLPATEPSVGGGGWMKRMGAMGIAGGGVLLGFSRVAKASSIAAAATAAVTTASSAYGTTASSASLPAWQLAIAIALMLPGFGATTVALLSRGAQASFLWYMAQLSMNPILTKSVTAGVIGAIGDYMAQGLERVLEAKSAQQSTTPRHQLGGNQNRDPVVERRYDTRRGLSCLLYGLLISGPLMHLAYDAFEAILPTAGAGGGLAAISHVLADSVFLDSIFVATTFIVTGVMEGYKWRQVWSQLKGDYVPTLKASWVTSLGLLPIEFICFRYLPVSLRVMAVNFIDVIWDTVISFMAHRSRGHPHNHHHEEQVLLLKQPQTLPVAMAEHVSDAVSIPKHFELPQLVHA